MDVPFFSLTLYLLAKHFAHTSTNLSTLRQDINPCVSSAVIKRANRKTGVARKIMPNFPKNERLLPSDTHPCQSVIQISCKPTLLKSMNCISS